MISVAILGTGIGAAHLNAYRNLADRYNVLWLVDKDVEKATSVAGASGTRVTASIEQVLADASVDLVDICLPPHLHAPVTCAALKAGKHVICEKPLALTRAELDEIRARLFRCGDQFDGACQ